MHAPIGREVRGKGTLAFRSEHYHTIYTSSGNRHWGA